ncbi:MAG: alpha-D-glucose phosphate-specific phosphoglucomutase [Proteobacteria bacterium]|nr:alpha-D-glucose phosphate-specific phosphoglucomutase [Pseudomonadota bacterium]
MSRIVSPLAGKLVEPGQLVDVPRLITAYFDRKPDPENPAQRVVFGTSGHRGSSFDGSFNENHILAVTQAICLHRTRHGVSGPLFIGIDTHALSVPALATALEVLAANEVETMIAEDDGFTPTPVISHAILTHNLDCKTKFSDGIVITPSHNPPADGGIKYNTPNGGPADTDVTGWIERTANALLARNLSGVRRLTGERLRHSPYIHRHDYITPYVADLENVVDMAAIRGSGVTIGIDPLGGAAIHYWQPIIARYGIAATVVNERVDPTFGFMTADWDGQIRMDCSSRYAMARLIGMHKEFDVAFANDADADRHGIVTRAAGLMDPNHYLCVAIEYLFQNRPEWSSACGIGKTIVSSSLIDRIAKHINHPVIEVPVGFKWFVEGLFDGALGFAGEESAGASFLRRDGTAWTTDKDGLIAGLLAAEITARTKEDPAAAYDRITKRFGQPFYERIDVKSTPARRRLLASLSAERLGITQLAGEPVRAASTLAAGDKAPIGGLKVAADNGWFAVRPSGTEPVYKIYAESFVSQSQLHQIEQEAQDAIAALFAEAEPGDELRQMPQGGGSRAH